MKSEKRNSKIMFCVCLYKALTGYSWDVKSIHLIVVYFHSSFAECHYTCRSCSGGGVYECTSCSGGDVLTNFGQCSANCFGGYYNDGGICKSKSIHGGILSAIYFRNLFVKEFAVLYAYIYEVCQVPVSW